ncbi:MAG: hypothetical protein DMF61_19995, partial [Blastocatellia bacterium AA13]
MASGREGGFESVAGMGGGRGDGIATAAGGDQLKKGVGGWQLEKSVGVGQLKKSGGGGQFEVIGAGAVVRHGPVVNSGRVEGSVRQLGGESVTLNGGAVITGDLLTPGSPQLTLNGNPIFGGTVQGNGSAQPSNYSITLNGGARLGRLVSRIDPIALPAVSAPPASTGTRDVTLNAAGQEPGGFDTIRDLTLNGNAGIIAVPPGTYRSFTANGGCGFTLGAAGAAQPSIYNMAALTLNGQSSIQVVGPVVLTIGGSMTVNGSMGSAANPLWLTLRVAAGGVTLNGGSSLSGIVIAPSGTVIINGNTTLRGSVFCDRLTINGGGVLQSTGDSTPPVVSIDSPCEGAVTTAASATISGTVSDSTLIMVTVNGVAATLNRTANATAYSAFVPLAEGANVLTAIATDLFNNTSQAARTVTRRAGANQPPLVNAGPDLTVILPAAATLNGVVTDEGLPTCAAVTTSWSTASGPGPVAFSNQAGRVTAAAFTAPGIYVLRLSASDTELSASDDVTVTVVPPNQAPVVSAGANQTIELPDSAALNGTAVDDGLPPGSTLIIAWTKMSGPGTVTFSAPNQARTTASFSASGAYVLQLTASDTQYTAGSTVTITVLPPNTPPVVSAGPDQTITLPAAAVLNGTVTDDGLPPGSALSISWSKLSGPGTATFANANQAATTATFST